MQQGVVLAARPGVNGEPRAEHFKTVSDIPIPTLGDEQKSKVLCKTHFISVDPYMRCRMNEDTGVEYVAPFEIEKLITSGGVGVVVASNDDQYKVGEFVECFTWPWTYTVGFDTSKVQLNKIPPGTSPLSLALGGLGMPGVTAALGLKAGKPQSGETVVISSAAGCCGSIAAQLAKNLGCHVVGITGSNEKVAYLTSELKCDGAINYKTQDVDRELKKLCEKGVDVYFDCVGGITSDIVIQHMNKGGRVPVIGQISEYNKDVPYPPPIPEATTKAISDKSIDRFRFLVLNYTEKFEDTITELATDHSMGRLVFKETVVKGLERAGEAFVSVMSGGNIGKQIVQIEGI